MVELYLISLVMLYLIAKYDNDFNLRTIDEFVVMVVLLPLVVVFMMVIDIVKHGEN